MDSVDSDQTGRMPRLIRVFAWHTGHFVGSLFIFFGLHPAKELQARSRRCGSWSFVMEATRNEPVL